MGGGLRHEESFSECYQDLRERLGDKNTEGVRQLGSQWVWNRTIKESADDCAVALLRKADILLAVCPEQAASEDS